MNYRQILLIGFFCLINLTIPGFAREWRSIFPLQTTCGELLKLLGEPQKNRAEEGEYFKVSDGIVKIRWQRPDCYGQVTNEPSAGAASLVYQLTFTPDEPLAESSIESEKKTGRKTFRSLPGSRRSRLNRLIENCWRRMLIV